MIFRANFFDVTVFMVTPVFFFSYYQKKIKKRSLQTLRVLQATKDLQKSIEFMYVRFNVEPDVRDKYY